MRAKKPGKMQKMQKSEKKDPLPLNKSGFHFYAYQHWLNKL
jgi:LAS superfamily LD-carboxypeptidase LdcB